MSSTIQFVRLKEIDVPHSIADHPKYVSSHNLVASLTSLARDPSTLSKTNSCLTAVSCSSRMVAASSGFDNKNDWLIRSAKNIGPPFCASHDTETGVAARTPPSGTSPGSAVDEDGSVGTVGCSDADSDDADDNDNDGDAPLTGEPLPIDSSGHIASVPKSTGTVPKAVLALIPSKVAMYKASLISSS